MINDAADDQEENENIPEAQEVEHAGNTSMSEAEDIDEESEALEHENEDEEFWNPSAKTTMFSKDFEIEESITPFADRYDE